MSLKLNANSTASVVGVGLRHAFLDALSSEGQSAKNVEAHALAVDRFGEFLAPRAPEGAEAGDVRAFLAYLAELDVSPGSRATYGRVLSRWLEFLQAERTGTDEAAAGSDSGTVPEFPVDEADEVPRGSDPGGGAGPPGLASRAPARPAFEEPALGDDGEFATCQLNDFVPPPIDPAVAARLGISPAPAGVSAPRPARAGTPESPVDLAMPSTERARGEALGPPVGVEEAGAPSSGAAVHSLPREGDGASLDFLLDDAAELFGGSPSDSAGGFDADFDLEAPAALSIRSSSSPEAIELEPTERVAAVVPPAAAALRADRVPLYAPGENISPALARSSTGEALDGFGQGPIPPAGACLLSGELAEARRAMDEPPAVAIDSLESSEAFGAPFESKSESKSESKAEARPEADRGPAFAPVLAPALAPAFDAAFAPAFDTALEAKLDPAPELAPAAAREGTGDPSGGFEPIPSRRRAAQLADELPDELPDALAAPGVAPPAAPETAKDPGATELLPVASAASPSFSDRGVGSVGAARASAAAPAEPPTEALPRVPLPSFDPAEGESTVVAPPPSGAFALPGSDENRDSRPKVGPPSFKPPPLPVTAREKPSSTAELDMDTEGPSLAFQAPVDPSRTLVAQAPVGGPHSEPGAAAAAPGSGQAAPLASRGPLPSEATERGARSVRPTVAADASGAELSTTPGTGRWELRRAKGARTDLSLDAIQTLAVAGELGPDDQVRKPSGEWVPARELRPLRRALGLETPAEASPASGAAVREPSLGRAVGGMLIAGSLSGMLYWVVALAAEFEVVPLVVLCGLLGGLGTRLVGGPSRRTGLIGAASAPLALLMGRYLVQETLSSGLAVTGIGRSESFSLLLGQGASLSTQLVSLGLGVAAGYLMASAGRPGAR